jgi:hypothetical protein
LDRETGRLGDIEYSSFKVNHAQTKGLEPALIRAKKFHIPAFENRLLPSVTFSDIMAQKPENGDKVLAHFPWQFNW